MRRSRLVAALLLAAAIVSLAAGYYLPAKAAAAQVLLRFAWERTEGPESEARPWPWARTWPVARLRVSKAGVDTIVLAGAEGAALAFAPGHLDGTALPGRAGNTVLAGHRDTTFRFLAELELGDELELETPDRKSHRFRVVDTRVVHETDMSVLDPARAPALTLVTCYPFDAVLPGGPLRYVVRAEALPDAHS